ncbi:MAG: hemerythrin domain-containing protein [Negativicutes bacterium]
MTAVFIFEAEEKLMLRYEYPCYAVHKEEHEQFKMQIAQFVEKQKHGTLILAFPIFDFLKDWLISHVLTIDKQYGPYINEKMKIQVFQRSLCLNGQRSVIRSTCIIPRLFGIHPGAF